MKIFLVITIAIMSLSTISYGQQKDIMDEITDESCQCIKPKEVEGMSLEELQVSLGLCLVESYSKHEKVLKKKGFTLTDRASMTKFGEEVGMRLTFSCPAYKNKVMALLMDKDSGLQELIAEEEQTVSSIPEVNSNDNMEVVEMVNEPINPPSKEGVIEETIGVFQGIKGTDYATIILKTEEGRLYEFLWLDYFEGSQALADNPDALKGKKIRISAEKKEYFLPKMKGYYGVAIARKIEVLSDK